MIQEYQIRILPEQAASEEGIKRYLSKEKGLDVRTLNQVRVLKRSVDARQRTIFVNLKVLVGFDTEGKIMGYTVLQASETPGLGAKAATWFQKDGKGSIIGKTPKDGDLHVSKDDKSGNAVDAITASTITSRAFLKAINQAYAVYAKKDVDGESGASQKADVESGASQKADGESGASKVEHNEKKG